MPYSFVFVFIRFWFPSTYFFYKLASSCLDLQIKLMIQPWFPSLMFTSDKEMSHYEPKSAAFPSRKYLSNHVDGMKMCFFLMIYFTKHNANGIIVNLSRSSSRRATNIWSRMSSTLATSGQNFQQNTCIWEKIESRTYITDWEQIRHISA